MSIKINCTGGNVCSPLVEQAKEKFTHLEGLDWLDINLEIEAHGEHPIVAGDIKIKKKDGWFTYRIEPKAIVPPQTYPKPEHYLSLLVIGMIKYLRLAFEELLEELVVL